MPEICRFFGIIIRMFFDDHEPSHFHAEYQGEKVVLDFNGNILKGHLSSRTAIRLIRDWIDLHQKELEEDWVLAKSGKEIHKISPLT